MYSRVITTIAIGSSEHIVTTWVHGVQDWNIKYYLSCKTDLLLLWLMFKLTILLWSCPLPRVEKLTLDICRSSAFTSSKVGLS